MQCGITVFVALCIAFADYAFAEKGIQVPSQPGEPTPAASDDAAPILVQGEEQGRFDRNLPDGGLKPVAGVHNIQVFRASRVLPDAATVEGWTYAHHQDLACWKGRLYAAWAMTPKDEDVPPYRVVYATSTNGIQWSAPTDLFPRGNAWSCRFYFYRSSNGRMLAFCAGKMSEGTVKEADKKVLLVREIAADHRLGTVYTLIGPLEGQPPAFETSSSPDFVAACREAVDHRPLLEQQDLGVFLGDRRMKWHENPPAFWGWPFGKAFCFYHRQDGVMVGISKQGFVTTSADEGTNWSKPTIPPTLTAGSGKIWGQRTADGRFALAYNPDPKRMTRYPLALVHGDDGCVFREMRVVHGELPSQRYPGLHKNLGPQYMRGLAEWADDGTFPDRQAMWLIYSVSKEDIWVSRIPLPIRPDEAAFPSDDFADVSPGGTVPGWNVYSPRWAQVALIAADGGRCLELRDGDPFDYARALRIFPASANPRVEFRIQASQTNALLEVELCDASGRRPVRVAFAENGTIQAFDGNNRIDLGTYTPGAWVAVTLAADLAAGACTVQVNDGEKRRLAVAEKDIRSVERLSFRTGAWRGCGGAAGAEPKSDVPMPTPAVFLVDRVTIRPL